MKFTVLCLLNAGKGLCEFVFSSRLEAVQFRSKNIKKYFQIFVYAESIE